MPIEARRLGFSRKPPYIIYIEECTNTGDRPRVFRLQDFFWIVMPRVDRASSHILFSPTTAQVRNLTISAGYIPNDDRIMAYRELPDIARRAGFISFHEYRWSRVFINSREVIDIRGSDRPGVFVQFRRHAQYIQWFNECENPHLYGCRDLLRDYHAGKIKVGKEAHNAD